MEREYISNMLGVDFTVYSKKMRAQCMEYAGWHGVYIDIFYFPKMTQYGCGHAPDYNNG